MSKKIVNTGLSVLLLALPGASFASNIESAAQIFTTPRGQQCFSAHIPDVHKSLIATPGGGFSAVSRMKPPGAPPTSSPPTLLNLSFFPQQLSVTPDLQILVNMSGSAADPIAPAGSVPFSASSSNTPQGSPSTGALDPSQYDAALAVSETLINQMLLLSYNRGYFKAVQGPDKLTYALSAPPVMNLDGGKADQPSLHLMLVSHQTDFFNQLVVGNNPVIDLDMDLGFETDQNGVLTIRATKVASGAKLASSEGFFGLFNGQVSNTVAQQIASVNKNLAETPMVLDSGEPLPNPTLGIPIQVKEVHSDGNGYLVFYIQCGSSS